MHRHLLRNPPREGHRSQSLANVQKILESDRDLGDFLEDDPDSGLTYHDAETNTGDHFYVSTEDDDASVSVNSIKIDWHASV